MKILIKERALRIPASPVEEISAVRLYRRPTRGFRFRAIAPVCHLLHYIVSGAVEQTSNGKKWLLKAGDVFWYEGDEIISGKIIAAPWVFYSVLFFAPRLPAPPLHRRRFHAGKRIGTSFRRLWKIWHSAVGIRRLLDAHGELAGILSQLIDEDKSQSDLGEGSELWSRVEQTVRRDLSQRRTLPQLARIGKCGVTTLRRACLAASGLPPMKRLKRIRMSSARGWVASSREPLHQIAERMGYTRVNEFSRDFHRYYHLSPRQFRQRLARIRPA